MKKEEKKYETLDQYDFPYNEEEIIFKKESEYAPAIGELLIDFSNLESALNLLVAEAINNRSHSLGYQVIKSLTYHNKTILLKSLYLPVISCIPREKLKMRHKKELDMIYRELSNLGDFRNKVVHANWVTLDKYNNVRTKITQDDTGFIQFIKIKITPNLIYEFSLRCRQLVTTLNHFHDKVFTNLI